MNMDGFMHRTYSSIRPHHLMLKEIPVPLSPINGVTISSECLPESPKELRFTTMK
jgi:hypothetical protein